MQQPAFWQNQKNRPGLLAQLLTPLSVLGRWATAQRLKRGPWHRMDIPVICIGNINIGGTGKTPTVIALAARLQKMGHQPHVVSRGYGGSVVGPVRVDERTHKADQVGDEPLLLSAFCTTWVSLDRHEGAIAAMTAGADVILLDDGFQNPTLHKDLSIVVVDAVAGFGNGRVFPAGPLRELATVGLARSDAVMVIGTDADRQKFLAAEAVEGRAFLGELEPLETGMVWQGTKVLAFAGIGRPAKFFATVKALGADLVHAEALSDHQPLTRPLMARLEAEAVKHGAQLVTTEKDAVRLPSEYQQKVVTVPVRLELDDWASLDELMSDLF